VFQRGQTIGNQPDAGNGVQEGSGRPPVEKEVGSGQPSVQGLYRPQYTAALLQRGNEQDEVFLELRLKLDAGLSVLPKGFDIDPQPIRDEAVTGAGQQTDRLNMPPIYIPPDHVLQDFRLGEVRGDLFHDHT